MQSANCRVRGLGVRGKLRVCFGQGQGRAGWGYLFRVAKFCGRKGECGVESTESNIAACTGLRRTWYLCWVWRECNPADPFSRIRSVWRGDYGKAHLEATRRLRWAMDVPKMLVKHVWTLGLPVIKQLQGHVGMKVRRPA